MDTGPAPPPPPYGRGSGTHQSFKKLHPGVQTLLPRMLKPFGKQGPEQKTPIPNEILKQSTALGVNCSRERPGTKCPGFFGGQFKTRRDSIKLFYCYSHLKFKDPEQPSTLPEAQRIPTWPGPRRRGEGKGQGQGRSPSLLLPGLRQQFGTTQRILPERTLPPVPCDPGSWATGLRPHSPRPRAWWTDRRRHFVAGDQHTTCVFPSHPPAAPRLDNGRKGRRCGPTSHSAGYPSPGPQGAGAQRLCS